MTQIFVQFRRRASSLTREELTCRLPDSVFAEATGVLEMIAKSPEERQHYEDRLKAERDEWARTAQAKLDGIEEGMEHGLRRGQVIGKIELLCQLLNQPYDGDRPLTELAVDELAALEAELQRHLRARS